MVFTHPDVVTHSRVHPERRFPSRGWVLLNEIIAVPGQFETPNQPRTMTGSCVCGLLRQMHGVTLKIVFSMIQI